MRSLDFGTGEDVKRGLDGGCVREETPVETEHSQETELADGLGRRAGLEVCDTFWKRLRSQGLDFVAEE